MELDYRRHTDLPLSPPLYLYNHCHSNINILSSSSSSSSWQPSPHDQYYPFIFICLLILTKNVIITIIVSFGKMFLTSTSIHQIARTLGANHSDHQSPRRQPLRSSVTSVSITQTISHLRVNHSNHQSPQCRSFRSPVTSVPITQNYHQSYQCQSLRSCHLSATHSKSQVSRRPLKSSRHYSDHQSHFSVNPSHQQCCLGANHSDHLSVSDSDQQSSIRVDHSDQDNQSSRPPKSHQVHSDSQRKVSVSHQDHHSRLWLLSALFHTNRT